MLTYSGVLLYFIIPPIVMLGIFAYRKRSIEIQSWLKFSLLLSSVALIYTTPWDNYLVASGVWYYSKNQVLGIVIGYVPIEEYSFFILETLMVSLVTISVLRKHETSIPRKNWFTNNIKKSLILSILWVLVLNLLIIGSDSTRYLALILVWAIPPIFIQLIYGLDILLHRKRPVIASILLSTLYLSLVDLYAISQGVWTIESQYIMGINFFGILPFEEVLFFFVTSVLVTLGMTLLTSPISVQRYTEMKSHIQNRGIQSGSKNGGN